jgi:hypothetical protein
MNAIVIRRPDGQRAASVGATGILFLGLLCPAAARAAWDFVPELGIAAQTEDNARLQPDTLITDTSTSLSMNLDAAATIATFDERGFLSFTPRLITYSYSEESDSDLESTDWYFYGEGERSWQTVTAGFVADLSRERLLSSELASVDRDNDPDTDDPDTGDTGRLAFIDEERERYYLNPYMSFRVSERNFLRFDAIKYEHAYAGGDRVFRSGYENTRFALSLQRNVDERNLVSATMSLDTYESSETLNTTDTVTIEGAFARPLSQLWTLNLGVGVLRSDFEFDSIDQPFTQGADTDYLVRIAMRKRGERSRMNIDFTRNIYPSATGYAARQREARVYYDHALTKRLNVRFGLLLEENVAVGDVDPRGTREYARAEVGFEWAIRQVLFLETGYNYTSQDFPEDIIQQRTDSNAIYIGMSYRGLSRR